MSDYTLSILSGLEEFQQQATKWNDLWQRSYSSQPTVRSEGISLWVDAFGAGKKFTAIVVERQGQFVAAIPLVRRALGRIVPVHELPVNCWANSGDLLLDRSANAAQALNLLIAGLKHVSVSFLVLDEISFASPQWVRFQNVLHNAGHVTHLTRDRPVGVVDILHEWDEYQASWPGKFRSSIRRTMKKLDQLGDVTIQRHREATDDEVAKLMRIAFEIEDRGWKGESGSSILRTLGMDQYMIREAQIVARAGLFDLWFLCLNDTPIAFEYCHLVKGICFSNKIGYDPEYRQLGPGRILKYHQLKGCHEDADCHLLDTLGLFCQWKAKWATRTYPVGRMYASIGSPVTKAVLRSYAWTSPAIRRFRKYKQSELVPKPEATRYLESAKSSARQQDSKKQEVPV